MRYRLVIFDFDGTLADSEKWFLKMLNGLADEMKFKRIKESDRELLRGYSSAEVVKHLGVPMWKVPRMVRRMRARAAEDSGAIKLFGGVAAMLRGLTEMGACLSVVSSNSEANIRRTLGAENSGLIRHYGCGASLFGKAPKLKGALRRSAVAPAEVIYVGDEIRDAVAARAAGMDFGAVAWGYTTIEALAAQDPALTFRHMEEIVPGIKG